MATIDKNFRVRHGLVVADSAEIGGQLTASGLRYPTQDGNEKDVLKTDGSGNLTFGRININEIDDVVLAGLREGGLLVYDSAAQKWVANNEINAASQDIIADGGFY